MVLFFPFSLHSVIQMEMYMPNQISKAGFIGEDQAQDRDHLIKIQSPQNLSE